MPEIRKGGQAGQKKGRPRRGARYQDFAGKTRRCLHGGTGSSALHLDFDLFGQAGVVFAQDGEHFFTTEMIRHFSAFGQHLTQLGTGQDDAVFLAVGAGTHGGHAVALLAVEGPVDLHGFAEQALAFFGGSGDLVEDFLGFEHAVEVAHTGVVAAHQLTVDTVVLAEGGVQQGFTRTSVTHVQRIAGLDHMLGHEVLLHQGDFIYAIIIEEMGIAGAAFVCLLYIILLFRTATIANRCVNTFPALLIMGFALLLVIQAMFNMAVAVGLVPVTGQPLPLISKGGTSTIVNCVYIGIILSVSYSAKKKDEDGDMDETKADKIKPAATDKKITSTTSASAVPLAKIG